MGELTVLVLDLVGLVYDYVVPSDLLEAVEANPHSLKTSDQYVELPLIYDLGQDLLSLILGGNKFHYFSAGQPLLELIHPIAQRDLGGDDDMRPIDLLVLLDEG